MWRGAWNIYFLSSCEGLTLFSYPEVFKCCPLRFGECIIFIEVCVIKSLDSFIFDPYPCVGF